jgi:hypothetical protein
MSRPQQNRFINSHVLAIRNLEEWLLEEPELTSRYVDKIRLVSAIKNLKCHKRSQLS